MVSQQMASKLLGRISADALWKSEVKLSEHTRLDFVGSLPSGKKIYVEVKNAMISYCKDGRSTRRAVFPEGYRKTKDATISPRAVKHAETLAELMSHPDTAQAYLLFIVPRNDCCEGLELNPNDPIYCNAIKGAIDAGVQVKVFGLDFHVDGSIYFNKELAFHPPK
jgi:hypothetical protein